MYLQEIQNSFGYKEFQSLGFNSVLNLTWGILYPGKIGYYSKTIYPSPEHPTMGVCGKIQHDRRCCPTYD
ncbi:MAG: hypothetical protein WB392_15655 [Methanotrichaceae archaeon]